MLKNKVSLILFLSLTLSAFSGITENHILSDVNNYLDYNLGKKFYSIKCDEHEKNHFWIEIYPGYTSTFTGDIIQHRLPEELTENMQAKLNSKYLEYRFTVKQMPQMPASLLNEAKKREMMKRLLFSSLIGVVALFAGFIIFRTLNNRRK